MKVYLDVYLDNNLGDDIMIKGILDRYENHSFTAVSTMPEVIDTYKNNLNIKFIHPDNRLSNILESDVYMTLGGSVFQFNTFRCLLSRIKKLVFIRRAKKRGVTILTVGSNLGPFNVRFGKSLSRLELKMNDHIIVRDKFSYDFIKKNVGKNVTLSDDIVFELVKQESIAKSDIVGVSCFNPVNHPEIKDDLINSYTNFIFNVLEETNNSVYLFAFDTLSEDDLEIANQINKRVKSDRLKVIPYNGDSDEFLSVFKQCSSILSVRFHSAVLAEIFGIPFYPISYANKMTNYISDSYKKNCLKLSLFSSNGLSYSEFKKDLLNITEREIFKPNSLKKLDEFMK